MRWEAAQRGLTDFRRIPWGIFATCAAITIAGLSGLVRADQLHGRTQLFERQMIWLLIAWPVMLGVTQIPYRLFRPWCMPFFLICVVLLAVALFMPAINGSRRWIPLGLLDFQPSEPARLGFILALSVYLMHRRNHASLAGLLPAFLMAVIPMLLVLKEPDLGTALLFLPVLFAMLLCAGARLRHLLAAAGLGLLCLPVLWQVMSAEQKSRIVSVFTQQDGGPTPGGDGFHLHQSKQVLALGGIRGSMAQTEPPVDDRSAWQLPASRTDFIFSVIGERYGLAGCAGLLICYVFLVVRGLQIAARTREPFGRLVAVGIVTMLGTQTLINAGMTVGLMPITGITLPMCSYGGSSLVSTCAAVGLLMNIGMRPGYEVAGAPFEAA